MGLITLIEQYETWARSNDVPVSTVATRNVLQRIVALLKPVHCVEIGTAVGLGTATLANQIAGWGGGVISFEISYPSYHKARLFVQSCHLFNTTLYHCDFMTCPLEKVTPESWDCVFVDGMKSLYTQYFDRCLSFCHEKTIFVFDDVQEHKDKIGNLAEHCEQQGRESTIVPTEPGDSVLIVYKKLSTPLKELLHHLHLQ